MTTRRRFLVSAAIAAAVLLAAPKTMIQSAHADKPKVIYHGNTDSKIFHKPGCRYYNCKKCTRKFESMKAAIDAGYRACKVCKP